MLKCIFFSIFKQIHQLQWCFFFQFMCSILQQIEEFHFADRVGCLLSTAKGADDPRQKYGINAIGRSFPMQIESFHSKSSNFFVCCIEHNLSSKVYFLSRNVASFLF